jgi:putative ABC transport system substrate-binding protein
MRRRDVLTLLGGAAVAWPFAIQAQTAKLRRIFWVSTESQPDPFVDGFREGLRERGYVEGKDVILELRYAPGNPDALRTVLAELTRGNADLAVSSGPAIRAMRAATDIPVLFAISGDPVQIGLVKSLARPGGNFTAARSFRSTSPQSESICSRIYFRNCAGSLCCRTPIILASAWNGTPLNRRRKS